MKKMKLNIIEHESFVNLFLKNNDIFTKIFGKNKFGEDLLKLGTLISRINNICEKLMPDYVDVYPDDYNMPGTGLLRFKGDIFEIFINAFLLIRGSESIVGVYDYKPEKKAEDWGVDGYGKGTDNKPLTVQIKFRSEYDLELLSKDIGQFGFQSLVTYGVDVNTSSNLLLITTCKGLNPKTHSKVFRSKIRTLNGDILKFLVDDNYAFWNSLQDIINNTIQYNFGNQIYNSLGLMNIELCDE